jgi:hypothetical protein
MIRHYDLHPRAGIGRPLNLDAPRKRMSQLVLLLRYAGLISTTTSAPAHRQRRADLVSRTGETSTKRRRG